MQEAVPYDNIYACGLFQTTITEAWLKTFVFNQYGSII